MKPITALDRHLEVRTQVETASSVSDPPAKAQTAVLVAGDSL